jgi:hypothetical protein
MTLSLREYYYSLFCLPACYLLPYFKSSAATKGLLPRPTVYSCQRALIVLTTRLIRYTGSCGLGASSRSSRSGSSSGSGSSGNIIQEGVLITLAYADTYLLNPVADTASGVSRIAGGIVVVVAGVATAYRASSQKVRLPDVRN